MSTSTKNPGTNGILKAAANDNGSSADKPSRQVVTVDVKDLLQMEIPPTEYFLDPWIRKRGLVMVFAERGVGKSHFALSIAHAVATGSEFMGRSVPKPKRVLYLDGEMPLEDLQDRLTAICKGSGVEPAEGYLTIAPLELQEDGMPDFSTFEGQQEFADEVEKADLVIVDNISTLCRSGEENTAESWVSSQNWSLSLRASGKSVLWVHHESRNGSARGTSKREDVLDTIIRLKRPDGVGSEEGARFTVSFAKNRGFTGEAAASFEVKLEIDETGAHWHTILSAEEQLRQLAAEYVNDNPNISLRDLADELGINKNKAGALKKVVLRKKKV